MHQGLIDLINQSLNPSVKLFLCEKKGQQAVFRRTYSEYLQKFRCFHKGSARWIGLCQNFF